MNRPTYPPAPGEDDQPQLALFPEKYEQAPMPPARKKEPEPGYLWFTPLFPREQAVEIFRKRYGSTPTNFKVEGGYLRVGPVPERE
jgi:hypothetical protein